jgi:hypothetical protein
MVSENSLCSCDVVLKCVHLNKTDNHAGFSEKGLKPLRERACILTDRPTVSMNGY